MAKNKDYDDEEMTVELELDDGTNVNCAVITILTVDSKDYIVLLPLNEEGEMRTVRYGSTDIMKIPMTLTKSLFWTISRTMRNMSGLQMPLMNIWTPVNLTSL